MPICNVSFEGFGWRNVFTIQSPTGKVINLACNGKWHLMSPALFGLIDELKSSKTITWGTRVEREVTKDVMNEILKLENKNDYETTSN